VFLGRAGPGGLIGGLKVADVGGSAGGRPRGQPRLAVRRAPGMWVWKGDSEIGIRNRI
jgi:hypothetical protein